MAFFGISKGMSNIQTSKLLLGRSQNFDFLGLKTFSCNLTIRGLGAKLRVAFILF